MKMRWVGACLSLLLSACDGGGSGGDGGDDYRDGGFGPDGSLSGDGDGRGDGDGDGDDDSDAGPTRPPQSQRIGPEGGTISAYGLTLEFPGGALVEETESTIAVQGSAPAGYETYSMVWDVGPDGLQLAKPAVARTTFE